MRPLCRPFQTLQSFCPRVCASTYWTKSSFILIGGTAIKLNNCQYNLFYQNTRKCAYETLFPPSKLDLHAKIKPEVPKGKIKTCHNDLIFYPRTVLQQNSVPL